MRYRLLIQISVIIFTLCLIACDSEQEGAMSDNSQQKESLSTSEHKMPEPGSIDTNQSFAKSKEIPLKKVNHQLTFMGGGSSGEQVNLYFKDKQNKTIQVYWDKSVTTFLPGSNDELEILKFSNNKLYVQYPDNQSCEDNNELGIVCIADQQFTMSLLSITQPEKENSNNKKTFNKAKTIIKFN